MKFSQNAAQFFEVRSTKPDLSKVALKAMHDKAMEHGLPLEEIKAEDKIPPALAQLIARAQSGDAEALKQLDDEYIHTSHRKLAVLDLRDTFGMDPAEGEVRKVFSESSGTGHPLVTDLLSKDIHHAHQISFRTGVMPAQPVPYRWLFRRWFSKWSAF